MLASFPASMLNQKPSDLGILNRFKLDPSRSRLAAPGSPAVGPPVASAMGYSAFGRAKHGVPSQASQGGATMIHSVFWLTGVITWGLIAAAGTTFLVADIHDRLVMRRMRVTAHACGAVDTWSLSRPTGQASGLPDLTCDFAPEFRYRAGLCASSTYVIVIPPATLSSCRSLNSTGLRCSLRIQRLHHSRDRPLAFWDISLYLRVFGFSEPGMERADMPASSPVSGRGGRHDRPRGESRARSHRAGSQSCEVRHMPVDPVGC